MFKFLKVSFANILLISFHVIGMSGLAFASNEIKFIAADEMGRDTPRGTLEGFLSAVKARQYEQASKYLDLKGASLNQGSHIAKSMRMVFDQKLWIPLNEISQTPEGDLNDHLLPSQEMIGRIDQSGMNYEIKMERVRRETGEIWLFSSATVDQMPELANRVGLGVLGKFLPESFFEFDFLGITCAEWLFFLAMTVLGMMIAWGVLQGVLLIAHLSRNQIFKGLINHIKWPLWILLSILMVRWVFGFVAFSVKTQMIMKAQTGVYLFLVLLLVRLLDYILLYSCNKLKNSGSPESAVLIGFIGKIIKSTVILAGLTLWLDNIGVKVTTLLAGIGIGGIAFALAAQKSIEDLFGAVTLILYRPLKHGDTIKFGAQTGTIEEIGVRYTRIRTPERVVINVPNGQLASAPIENLSRRDKIRYYHVLDLGYETTPDQMRYVLVELRKMLYSDPRIADDPACWVRFKEFGAYSLKIEISAWVLTNDSGKFRAITEDLHLKIMEIIPAAGVNFAFPTQVEYHADTAPVNLDLRKKSEDMVRMWKAQGKLFMEEFPKEEIQSLRSIKLNS